MATYDKGRATIAKRVRTNARAGAAAMANRGTAVRRGSATVRATAKPPAKKAPKIIAKAVSKMFEPGGRYAAKKKRTPTAAQRARIFGYY